MSLHIFKCIVIHYRIAPCLTSLLVHCEDSTEDLNHERTLSTSIYPLFACSPPNCWYALPSKLHALRLC